ncbi:DUF6308 family protein [Prescottella subtropica]|uniref:DUF6308 family protein n=1 Tax=Prescottella subtropica TaxID=2545757 RepID=UPI0010F9E120|nr:DUF6308 family protein [Prescottella subtropica]
MTIRLPKILTAGDDAAAVDVLHDYFRRPWIKTGRLRSGALWDGWDTTGTRGADADVFTADDLVAVTCLSVDVSPDGADILLRQRRDEFTALLRAVGPDRDLVDEPDELTPDWPAWQLETALWTIPSIGRTVASKLIARKRPRLYPIYDRVVGEVLGTKQAHLEPVRQALRADDRALHRRLVALHDQAGLPDTIPALRILDVLAWMQLKAPR